MSIDYEDFDTYTDNRSSVGADLFALGGDARHHRGASMADGVTTGGVPVTYPAILPDGHIVVRSGERYVLIDTGSPVTHVRGATRLIDFDNVSRLVGVPLDVILGNDGLTDPTHGFTLTRAADGEAVFRAGPPAPVNGERVIRLPFTRRFTLPVTTIRLGFGYKRVQAIIDTGAVISFAPASWLERHGGRPVDVRHEFFHGLGGFAEFDTPVYQVPALIDGQLVTVRMGSVPEHIGGSTFIVGNDLLLSGQRLTYDAEQQYFAIA